MEYIIVGLIVLIAGWVVWRKLRNGTDGSSCSCGCCHCHEAQSCKPEQDRTDK